MKNIKLLSLLSVVFFFFGLSSCNKEAISPSQNLLDIESSIQQLKTTCNIVGNSCVAPGSTVTYTYSSDFTTNNVSWSFQSGNISILSGQGTNKVTLKFGSGFNGGTIYVIGSGNGGIVCSAALPISKCVPSCTPPTEINIDQISGACHGDVFTFSADLNGSTNNGSYHWSVFQGASIINGQGTSIIKVQSPSGGFSISVKHINSCQNKKVNGFTLAEFSGGCGGW